MIYCTFDVMDENRKRSITDSARKIRELQSQLIMRLNDPVSKRVLELMVLETKRIQWNLEV